MRAARRLQRLAAVLRPMAAAIRSTVWVAQVMALAQVLLAQATALGVVVAAAGRMATAQAD
jgi:hypothetical protein